MSVTDPKPQSNGFIFVRIQGGFHEIRNSVSIFIQKACPKLRFLSIALCTYILFHMYISRSVMLL